MKLLISDQPSNLEFVVDYVLKELDNRLKAKYVTNLEPEFNTIRELFTSVCRQHIDHTRDDLNWIVFRLSGCLVVCNLEDCPEQELHNLISDTVNTVNDGCDLAILAATD